MVRLSVDIKAVNDLGIYVEKNIFYFAIIGSRIYCECC